MKRKIAYAIARESADDKTLQNQIDVIHKTAKSLGYVIEKEFKQNVSGDVTKVGGQDPQYIIDLRNAIREKKPDAIFCYWIDRMTRTTYKQGAYLNEFSVIPQIPIYFTRVNKWTINPDTRVIDDVFLAELSSDMTPQKERENIVARTTPVREKVAAEGYYIGHLSDGYCVKEEWGLWDDGHRRKLKTIKIDEDRRRIIENIYALYLQGFSTDKIADTLNAKGVPTTNKYRSEHHDKFGHRANYKTRTSNGILKKRSDAKWTGSLVAQILQNEWYKGIRHYQGIEHHHDPIVSAEDWNLVQTIREERSKTFRSKRESIKHIYLLQDLIFCGICGRKLYGHYTGLNNHYFCSSIEYGQKCGLRGVCKENIEACVYECCTSNAYQSVFIGEENVFSDFFKLDKEKEKQIKEEIKYSESIIKDQEKLISEKNSQIDALIDLQAENAENKDLIEKYKASISQRYEEIQKAKDKITKERVAIKRNNSLLRSSTNAKTILKNIKENRDLSNIKLFFRTVIDKIILFNTEGRNNIVRIYFKTGKTTEFIYSAQAMPGKVMPLYEPLYYNESTNRIESNEYPVYISDGIPFVQSFIDDFKEGNFAEQNYSRILEEKKTSHNTLRIDNKTDFTVSAYVLYLKSLPTYNSIPNYTRLEETDELGELQREHYKQWRKKYNTGKPTQEPYVLHNENYADICLKRKHLYNRRYKIKNNKSLSDEEKKKKLDNIKYQLDLLSAQVPYIEGYEGKRKKGKKE